MLRVAMGGVLSYNTWLQHGTAVGKVSCSFSVASRTYLRLILGREIDHFHTLR